ncbi:MAG: hypothetical protein UW64_C0016G0008 [Microgenomates group bacterium GW2011_GWC1_44_37]|uniref:Uncharacterized protein n=1 Tax=Candidatus Collierbacteria bacterium GW2011_GWB2_44_22 TaxID=1618387 RepID=A0A0G1K4Z0_9BACT|nr:MAG: hypothetical protein UW31_C0006G0066 [Candidatus Collierbacteria bacterium GW2011_GWA2_44_13]KKT50044.1 MAG: hypothetical protein UW42_C0025G0006 [Candidatus Collierbacteria bacterium GW2011_GWB1_44_197]KKT51347.1 MAG: hypothetical protein UW44_C0013G0067 [Candidatus Collierbacteria bacterium GW2011_GWB2_44_22]KKT61475.1 MAG: hypothetical protein UW56_C0025G0012 [Candidatus Collierbacteria bacterium GW2011_GWD1_44_27]KKT65632.1 MAG: hypothetical protein UW58_C0024G0011 [Candidatus Colli
MNDLQRKLISALEEAKEQQENQVISNKIIHILITVTSFVVIPVQIVSTFVLGILVSLTFGLLLIPISIVWMAIFFYPLLGLSYVYERIIILRPFISIIGIPLAVIGDIYVALMPSMGEMESRYEKLIICQTFPYTWKYLQLVEGKINIKNNDSLTKILREVSNAKPLKIYLDKLRVDVVSRPGSIKRNYQLDW